MRLLEGKVKLLFPQTEQKEEKKAERKGAFTLARRKSPGKRVLGKETL